MNYSLHLSSRLTLILCTVGILPAMSQQQEKELQLNMYAVKMIKNNKVKYGEVEIRANRR